MTYLEPLSFSFSPPTFLDCIKRCSLGSKMALNILLDPSIRDWVLLPLTLVVLFVNILRHYLGELFESAPSAKLSNIANSNVVAYGRLLIGSGGVLSTAGFKERIEMMLNKSLKREVPPLNPMEMMNDPNVMMGMMKQQLLNMGPNIGMMMLVTYFFSGFVVAKIPFSLSPRFKGLTQSGMDIDDLDCSYITSLSMFLLMMSGCQGVLQLILGEDATVTDQSSMMMQQMQATNQPVDYGKVFKQMTEELNLIKGGHKWGYSTAPESLLKEWKSKKRGRKAIN
ncbi:hypothetical protein AGDE_02014 [Angomonas deanei]|nr:hypothetical protein AGDE_11043 [Angomonas deanei]EPY41909.1 hypothetical protein AGDE_02014 [Angomonas deanei]|eukprot:EPY26885.1 hypothetical protein AGDE_11043 [Angomonas deanei]